MDCFCLDFGVMVGLVSGGEGPSTFSKKKKERERGEGPSKPKKERKRYRGHCAVVPSILASMWKTIAEFFQSKLIFLFWVDRTL